MARPHLPATSSHGWAGEGAEVEAAACLGRDQIPSTAPLAILHARYARRSAPLVWTRQANPALPATKYAFRVTVARVRRPVVVVIGSSSVPEPLVLFHKAGQGVVISLDGHAVARQALRSHCFDVCRCLKQQPDALNFVPPHSKVQASPTIVVPLL